ncbi:MAG TPA: MBOAT family O-acyltransferase [Steroidobacteraceae bacterium]
MVFASQAFLAFLAIVLGVYWLLGCWSDRAGKAWLISASLFFYGYWSPPYLLLLLGSIVVNFVVVKALLANREPRLRALLAAAGILLNIGLIAYYKYFAFLIETLNFVTASNLQVPEILLPIGISFFTFQQIGLLVDTWKGRVERLAFWDHVYFIAFFPQLIAGPIVSQQEMLPQLAAKSRWLLDPRQVAVGAALFSIGMFKKTVLADSIVRYVDAIYTAADRGLPIGMLDGWAAGVGYGFQVYFDFSGYSDMAIGLGIMFGFSLPLNFYSPYKAASIRAFWRRWHVTLSRFLRNLLFIPMGGSRHGLARTILALIATMGIGGLWHGAGWTFVVWGLLHGAYLAINHLWIAVGLPRFAGIAARVRASPGWSRFVRALCVLLTFAAVSFAWVFFRANDMESALHLASAMFGLGDDSGVASMAADFVPILFAYFLIVWCLPSTMEIFARCGAILHIEDYDARPQSSRLFRVISFRLSGAWAAASALVLLSAWFAMSKLSPFIYYQF